MKPRTRSVKALQKSISSFFKKATSVGKSVMTSVRRLTRRMPRPICGKRRDKRRGPTFGKRRGPTRGKR